MAKGMAMKKSSAPKATVVFEVPTLERTVSPPEGWVGRGHLSTKKNLLLARNTEREGSTFIAREFDDIEAAGIYLLTGELLGNCEEFRVEANDVDRIYPPGPFSFEVTLYGGDPLHFKCSLSGDDVQSFLIVKGFKISRY